MEAAADAVFTEQEEAEKRGFREEREDPFHEERLPDDGAGEL